MKKLFTLTLLLIVGTITAQDANVFLNRGFFKPATTVKEVQQKVKEGNSL